MKYAKYVSLVEQHPWLSEAIRFCLCRFTTGSNGNMKEIVRTKIGFVAPRPYNSLALLGKDASSSQTLPSPYKYAVLEKWSSVNYSVHFQISGDAHERIVFPDGGRTVVQLMEEVKEWFLKCESFKDQTMVILGIIKQSRSGSSHTGLTNVNIEFYEPPVGQRAIHYPSKATPKAPDEAARAYVDGTPMPPIIPGT